MVPPPAMPRLPRVARAALLAAFLAAAAAAKKKAPKRGSACATLTPDGWRASLQGRDALVLFVTASCPHCRVLEPTFEALCAAFRNEEGVVLGIVDGTKHEALVDSQAVYGFPHLKWYPRREHSIAKGEIYQGERVEGEILAFVNERAGTRVAAPSRRKAEQRFDGRVRELDGFVDEFFVHFRLPVGYVEASQREVIAKVKRRLGAMRRPEERSSADYYMATMEGVLADGAGHVEHERARLQQLVDDGALGDEKAELMRRRLSVLRAFAAALAKHPPPRRRAAEVAAQGEVTEVTRDERRRHLEELPRAALVELVLALHEVACPEADALVADAVAGAADAG